MKRTIAVSGVYIAAIVAANLLVVHYGPKVTIVNAFALIGLDLALRDWIDERTRNRLWYTPALIVTAGVIAYTLNTAAARIAIASAVAFTVAAFVDLGVYRFLRSRGVAFADRANTSNVAGAAVDSFLFPALAFGYPFLWLVMFGQFAAKVGGGAVIVTAINLFRRSGDTNQPAPTAQYPPHETINGIYQGGYIETKDR